MVGVRRNFWSFPANHSHHNKRIYFNCYNFLLLRGVLGKTFLVFCFWAGVGNNLKSVFFFVICAAADWNDCKTLARIQSKPPLTGLIIVLCLGAYVTSPTYRLSLMISDGIRACF